MNRHPLLRWTQGVLFVLGILLIGLWLRHDTEARAFRTSETKQLDRAIGGASALLASTEPWSPTTLPSGVFGRIEIPRLGISALIAEGTEPEQLDHAIGHIATTVFPGQAGNCALAGHRDTFLRGLGEVRENDVIRIDTLQGTYTYAVVWGTVVGPHRVDVLAATSEPSLTLVTCYPFHAVGPAPQRFVVRARQIEVTAGATESAQGQMAEGGGR